MTESTAIDSVFTAADGATIHVTTFGDRSGAGGSPHEQAAGPGLGTEQGC